MKRKFLKECHLPANVDFLSLKFTNWFIKRYSNQVSVCVIIANRQTRQQNKYLLFFFKDFLNNLSKVYLNRNLAIKSFFIHFDGQCCLINGSQGFNELFEPWPGFVELFPTGFHHEIHIVRTIVWLA